MRIIITIIVIALIALFGSQYTFLRRKLPLGTRHILLTGTEFIFIGLLLGPNFLNFIDNYTIKELHPLLSFSLGWIGFLFGLQFNFSKIKNLPHNYFSITFIQAFFTALLVFFVFYFLFLTYFNYDRNSSMILSLVLAAASGCTGQASMAIVHRDFRIASRGLMNLFRYIAGVDALFSILILGIALCYNKMNGNDISYMSHLLTWSWFGVSLALGVIMGFAFHFLTYEKLNQDELLLIIIGLVTFSAGIALFLKLSPLMINLIMGYIVANRSTRNTRVMEIMIRAEKSIYILLVILAGASWKFDSTLALILAAVYIVVRIGGKLLGGITASNFFSTDFEIPRSMGLGLLSQGGIAIAIIINFQQVYDHASMNLILTIVILAAIINELISPAFVLRLVRRQ